MPFNRPTLSELINKVESDINTSLVGADAKLKNSVLNVLARTLAGATHGLYGYLYFISKQALVTTAQDEYLDSHAAIWEVIRKPASKATGEAEATGVDGSVIVAGTELQRSDGVKFITLAEAIIAAGVATLSLEAVEAGAEGNTTGGSILTFTSTPAGVNSQVEVSSDGLIGGADIEDDESLRARILARIQLAPHGGAAHDYIAWALEVSGVTRAWVYPKKPDLGDVTVRFMMDDSYSDGIPLAGDVTTVKNYIDARAPVTATVYVLAPVAVPLNFTIELLLEDSLAIRAAVEAELEDMIKRDASPGGVIYLSRISEAISAAEGEVAHTLTVPAADVTHTVGQIATMGTITWI